MDYRKMLAKATLPIPLARHWIHSSIGNGCSACVEKCRNQNRHDGSESAQSDRI